MLKTFIKEFTYQTTTFFASPIPKDKAGASQIVENLRGVIGGMIDIKNISLLARDDLFDYRLLVPIFGGAGQIIVDAYSVTSTLPKGVTKQNLDLVVDCFENVFKSAVVNPRAQNKITFMAHCIFASASDYSEHMKPFIDSECKITSGGRVLIAEGLKFAGIARISTEKSDPFENAIFICSNCLTNEPIERDLVARMSARSSELLAKLDLEVTFDPVP